MKNNIKLCLNMIVKNESKIITRLLESVLSIIDCYCICDTGSTDNTIELINEFSLKHNIPGKVIKEEFKNFCYNRNVALTSCIGMSDYILLLDADMIIKINGFDKNKLNKYGHYYIFQGNDNFYYKNVRIIKNDGKYKYEGVTHEYLSFTSSSKWRIIEKNEIFILDIGDGGCKNNKFERDIILLTEGIKEEPRNERYHFYLANTYFDLGRITVAIEYYKKRIKLGGWYQEIWYSYYKIGLGYLKMNEPINAINSFIEGINIMPNRIENIYEIVKYYREISKHNLSYFFYKMAKEAILNNSLKDDYLFLHNTIYTFKLEYEYSIIAYYLGFKNIDEQIIQILNNSDDNSINDTLLSNMKYYKTILKPIKIYDFSNKIKVKDIIFNSSSSCLIKSGSGYEMNIRYVNYTIDNNGDYLDCSNNIITVNKYIKLNDYFEIIEEKTFLLEELIRLYNGIEDIRIFKNNNELLFIGTGYHKNNKIGIVHGKYGLEKEYLEGTEINPSFNNNNCEKNWVYINYNNKLCIIYDWFPLQICKISENGTALNKIEIKNTPNFFRRIRGSTCGFNYLNDKEEEEIWFITHLVSYERPRHYYHIIIILDKELEVKRYSAPFKFSEEPIEYCLSIIVEKEKVIINYSEYDRTTKIGIYEKSYIDGLLNYN